ncbi:MAG TPA: hypothetical protein VL832_22320 [Puia sp.]|nr:hypothetical protein [Puia sp.]
MKADIMEGIARKTGIPQLADLLAHHLSGSELNSLLLEVFNKKLQDMTPARLLKLYQANRFVHPADSDMIDLLTLELRSLQFLRDHHFQPIELSPAAQLGTCSVVAPADQHKIISATRNTEIMADATNALALYIADLKKSGNKEGLLRFCTTHRHIRTQEFKAKGHTPHFKIGCLVSSGRDTGSYQFECTSLLEHLLTLDNLLRTVFDITSTRFKIQSRLGYDNPDSLLEKVTAWLKTNSRLNIITEEAPVPNNYYKGLQFKMIVQIKGEEREMADGGFVDWTQQLLENKKERLLISGFGLELLHKFGSGSL